MTQLAIDLFAGGARGWDVHDTELGLRTLGYELDPDAHATALAAGYDSHKVSVSDWGPPEWSGTAGLKGSPPCQTFSTAGLGAGRRALEDVYRAMGELHQTGRLDYSHFTDERTGLVLEPLRWALGANRARRPFRWIVLEQVPPVLPVWEAMAKVLESIGYSVATGNLHAEQYGVPQTRKRAALIASLDREAHLPAPTHSKYYPRTPGKLDKGVLPWVSMADAFRAVGWTPDTHDMMRSNYGTGGDPAARGTRDMTQPAPTVTGKINRNKWMFAGAGATSEQTAGQVPRGLDAPAHTVTGKGTAAWVSTSTMPNATHRPLDAPAPTIAFGKDAASYVFHNGEQNIRVAKANGHARRVSIQEATVLQSLPVGHPWQGYVTRQYQQVGNAIPGLLAKAILECVL